jgi:hypothetical protein
VKITTFRLLCEAFIGSLDGNSSKLLTDGPGPTGGCRLMCYPMIPRMCDELRSRAVSVDTGNLSSAFLKSGNLFTNEQ